MTSMTSILDLSFSKFRIVINPYDHREELSFHLFPRELHKIFRGKKKKKDNSIRDVKLLYINTLGKSCNKIGKDYHNICSFVCFINVISNKTPL